MLTRENRPAPVRWSVESDYGVGTRLFVAGGAVLVIGSGISTVAAVCLSPVLLTPPIVTVWPGFKSAVLAVTSLIKWVLATTVTVCVVPSAYLTVT